MDGNGRWARQRGLPRTKGHLEGLKAAKRVIAYLAGLPIEHVTLYTFSTENWKRPRQEVRYLMGLVSKYLLKELPFYQEHNIRVTHIGRDDQLPQTVLDHLSKTEEVTGKHTGLQVTLAINYGGRDEVLRGINTLLEKSRNGTYSGPCTIDDFSQILDTAGMPDPELIIRSAGEKRLSNFLIWQGAYAEFCFVDAYWPDWDGDTVQNCLQEFQKRTRRFGGLIHE